MKKIPIASYIGYAVSLMFFLFGAAMLGDVLPLRQMPGQFRYMFGVVLILWGIYRFVGTRSRDLQRRREEDEEE